MKLALLVGIGALGTSCAASKGPDAVGRSAGPAAAAAASASASASTASLVALPPDTIGPPGDASARSIPSATAIRAGGRVCAPGNVFDLARLADDTATWMDEPNGVAFGPKGGIVIWQSGDHHKAFARPIDREGAPTGPANTFATPGDLYVRKVLGFDGGFAIVAAASNPYEGAFVILLAPDGSPLAPPKRIVGEDFAVDSSGVSATVGNRFVVFGAPNATRQTTTSHATLVAVDAKGAIATRDIDVAAARSDSGEPSAAFAVGRAHWAIAVGVPKGGALLLVDGRVVPISGGAPSRQSRWALGWIAEGVTLGMAWAAGDFGETPRRQAYATLTMDGRLSPSDEKTARAALDAPVDMDIVSGSVDTAAFRGTILGESFGDTALAPVLTGTTKGLLQAIAAWTGERYVIAYATQRAPRILRAVSLRCDGS